MIINEKDGTESVEANTVAKLPRTEKQQLQKENIRIKE